VAIARFRLTLAFLEKRATSGSPRRQRLSWSSPWQTRCSRTQALPRWPWHPANARKPGSVQSAVSRILIGHGHLGKRHAAVVGNPPYITVKDPAKRLLYGLPIRAAPSGILTCCAVHRVASSSSREKAARRMITTPRSWKREFGKRSSRSTCHGEPGRIVTPRALHPGHGTPTVLVSAALSQNREPRLRSCSRAAASRRRPKIPSRACLAEYREHWNEVGFENEYISVAQVNGRASRSIPGASAEAGSRVKVLLDERAQLACCTSRLHRFCVTGEDTC